MKFIPIFFFILILSLRGNAQKQFSILISEIFPDPSPVIGLPAFEFIELHNNTSLPIPLKNWKISDGSSTALITSPFILLPDSNLILCSSAAYSFYKNFGQTVSVSNFPSLNNDKDELILYNPEGHVIHAIAYDLRWYHNDLKKEGGWSIEMIDLNRPCAGADNFKASTHPTGGTPGTQNAVNGHNPDTINPILERAYFTTPNTIKLIFSEPLDSMMAASPLNYWIDGQHPGKVTYQWPQNQQVLLENVSNWQKDHIYKIVAEKIRDCSGNSLIQNIPVFVSLSTPPKAADLVINEILFNPPINGFDYVEIYNKSDKTIDLSEVLMASKDAFGNLVNPITLSDDHHLIFPAEYKVFTENKDWLQSKYKTASSSNSQLLASMPSMPDEGGTLVLTDQQGMSLDELQYKEAWHFPLLFDKEGVSLERIDVLKNTNDANNWTSAAANFGYGTPGVKNSQVRSLQTNLLNTPKPSIFSPNQDGKDDFLTVYLWSEESNTMGNIFIYDKTGHKIRTLQQQQLLAIGMNSYNWNGLDDQYKKLPTGIYIVQTQIIHSSGKIKMEQYAIALIASS